MTESHTLPHRMLGRTGLQVSVLSYGFWATFGVKEGLCSEDGIEKAMECLSVARNAGVNLFDNAEVYGSPRGAAAASRRASCHITHTEGGRSAGGRTGDRLNIARRGAMASLPWSPERRRFRLPPSRL